MIEILATSLFVISSIYGAPTSGTEATTTAPGVTSRETAIEVTATSTLPTKKQLEKKVRAYFKEDPILIEIARCESQFRQYDSKGEVLKGKVNKGDLGVMQINRYYHEEKADSLGYDIETVEGNLAYAKYLYDHEGSTPWMSSSKCWKDHVAPPVNGDEDNNNIENQIALK